MLALAPYTLLRYVAGVESTLTTGGKNLRVPSKQALNQLLQLREGTEGKIRFVLSSDDLETLYVWNSDIAASLEISVFLGNWMHIAVGEIASLSSMHSSSFLECLQGAMLLFQHVSAWYSHLPESGPKGMMFPGAEELFINILSLSGGLQYTPATKMPLLISSFHP